MPLVRGRWLEEAPVGPDGLSEQLVVEAIGPTLTRAKRLRVERVLHRRLLSVTVVLEDPHDPHNGAAVLRTCEAMGLHHVHVVEKQHPFACSRKVSQHTHRWLTVYLHRSTSSCLRALQQAGFACWGALPPPLRGTAPEQVTVDVSRPVALVFGNEHLGLSAEARELCQGRFSIPMHGFCESLNLSVSAAVALATVVRERRLALGRAGDLPPGARNRLRAAYYAASSPHAVSLVRKALRPQ